MSMSISDAVSTPVSLSDDDLQVIRHALEAYVVVFGHDESDVRRRAQGLLARLPAPSLLDDVAVAVR